jgi:N-acetylglutamate synthase-like GNAT family acetyltransferase
MRRFHSPVFVENLDRRIQFHSTLLGASPARIRPGSPEELPAVRELLEGAGLPTADLASAPGLQLWVLEEGDSSIVGAIALERFAGNEALLRSLVIVPASRGRGFGQQLVARVEKDSREAGIHRLVLLTQTAASFFERSGYAVIDRQSVGGAVRESEEFRSLCPASAVCMAKSLR